MEIHGSATTLAPVVSRQRDAQPCGSGDTPLGNAAGERTDTAGGPGVNLSGRARRMLAAKQAVDAALDVREGRVTDLKCRVAAGAYDVHRRLVAEALVRQALLEAVA
jgi:anti-sigma28 factor (negative regulator of flagellin synthesis)